MSDKWKPGNLSGTMKEDFEVGKGGEYGMRRDTVSGQLKMRDPEVGEHPLIDFLNGGGSADFDLLLITTEGGLLYDNSGAILLKENP